MGNVELIEYTNNISDSITNPKIDGFHKCKLEEHMLEKMEEYKVLQIFSNAYKSLPYLINPYIDHKKKNKVLCLGKVQSGKTGFFICTIALAFDNGYDLAYVIGGTKTKLKDQNYTRLSKEFKNNNQIKIIDINSKEYEDPKKWLDLGYKVIVVALKNISSDSANLGKIEQITAELGNIPSIIIDDEGDECSPGAPKLKSRNARAGRTHDVLVDIINNIDVCSFFSVTATPQANFLISTIDAMSPDYAILVEPGEGYTGGNSFHDIYDNPHVIEINDSDNFKDSIPQSFIDAFYFYIFSILTLNHRNDYKPYSMLVHPSSLTKVHSMVYEKINDFYLSIYNVLKDEFSFEFDDVYKEIYNQGKFAVNDFNDYNDFKDKTISSLNKILENITIYEFNVSKNGKDDIIASEKDAYLYKIYVGGNMLGRGLTIENLNVTYMYRDSKVSQIDTLYQRARWFGYKSDYFDLCRVYMTKQLKQKFVDTVENENDMWNAMNSFLLTKTDIKAFPRIFSLNNDKLRLTRTTISKTVCIERINPGYEYDKSINLTKDQLLSNRKLYSDFLEYCKSIGKNEQFGTSDRQQHLIAKIRYDDFFYNFIDKYNFPRGSKFGKKSFKEMLDYVNEKIQDEYIIIIFMRYKTGEYRTSICDDTAIKELPQSYNNGTDYPGDKNLTGYSNLLHVQIHPVYIDESKPLDIIPLIALNNPITENNIKYVTGDNYYGSI